MDRRFCIDGLSRAFCFSVALALVVTGAAKLRASLLTDALVQSHDPILGLTRADVYLGVGSIEILVAVFAILIPRVWALTCILWLAGCFAAYRLTGMLAGSLDCPCLGDLGSLLGWPKGFANIVASSLVVYMLAGALLLLVALVFERRSFRTIRTGPRRAERSSCRLLACD